MSESASIPTNPILIDLGKRKRNDVKKLSKGKGTLMAKISDAVNELKAEKEINEDSQIVIVIVKEKSKKSRVPWFK